MGDPGTGAITQSLGLPGGWTPEQSQDSNQGKRGTGVPSFCLYQFSTRFSFFGQEVIRKFSVSFLWKLMKMPSPLSRAPAGPLSPPDQRQRFPAAPADFREALQAVTFRNSLKSASSSVFCCNKAAPLSWQLQKRM